MDSNNEKSFIVTKKHYQIMNELEETFNCLSLRQQEQDWELYKAMGNPMLDDLKEIIEMNIIKNNVVTTDDVDLASGLNVGGIKSKTTKSCPTKVVNNIV